MAKHNIISIRITGLERCMAILRSFVRVSFALFGLSIGYLVLSLSVPQQEKLRQLESNLADAKQRENEALGRKRRVETNFRALNTDLNYLENQARDRLDYYLPDEKVLRFRND